MAITSRFQSHGLLRGAAWLLLALWSLPLFAAEEGEPAGYVLTSSGEVVAVQVDMQLRPLKRKSPFFSGESLRTGNSGKAQLRFRDGSLISMRASTEIHLDEYRFNEPQKGRDRNIFTLISGGFRTITGKIGKGDPDAYQMKSSVASIGVRGTTYEAVLNGGLDVAAWQGTIIVANEGGSMAVGVEGAYNFASVQSSARAPRGLMKPPASIRERQEINPGEMKGEQSGVDGHDGERGGGEERAATQPLGSGDRNDVGGDDYVDRITSPNNTMFLNSGDAEEQVNSAYDDFTSSTTTPVTNPPPTTAPPVVADYRVDGVTLDRLAMTVVGGTGFNAMLAGGKAGYDLNGVLRIADNTLDPSQAGFDTAPYLNVLSQGAAVASPVSSHVIDASHSVEWGVWQATAAAPAYLMTDATNAAVYTAVTQPVYWISAIASPNTAVSARTGMVEFRQVLGFAGESNSGAINNLYLNLSVNFDTATAIGEAHLYAPGQYWDLYLDGTVAAPTLQFTSISGTLNGSGSVQGEFSTLFTGKDAQAIVSVFDLEQASAPLNHIEGVVLVDDLGLDLRLTAAEVATLDRLGFISKSNAVAGVGVKPGKASDGASGTPLFALPQLLPSDPFFNSGLYTDLLRRNGVALLQGSYTHASLPVSWGVWDVGTMLQLSSFDPAATNSLMVTEPIVWMTVAPTLDTALAPRVGQGFYQLSQCCTPGYFGLVDSGGQISSTSFDLSVDFDKASFFGWLNLGEQDGDTWGLQFKGNIQGAQLAINAALINAYYYHSPSNYGVTGDIAMTFTGANAEGLAVLYDLEAAGLSSFYVQGGFVAEQDLRLVATELNDMRHLSINAGPNWGNLFRMSTSAGAGQPPVFAGDISYNPNSGEFSLATNGPVWRKGNSTETKLGTRQVAGDPAYGVDWGYWDGTATQEIVSQNDPANPASQSLVTGTHHWLVFNPTPPSNLPTTGTINYTVPVALSASGADGPITLAGFTFSANLDFSTGALNSGLITLSSGPSWNMTFSAPPGSLGSAGAFSPNIGASGTYTNGTPVTASGDVNLMTTGPNAEALAGGFNFWNAGATKNVEGVFLVCQSGGC